LVADVALCRGLVGWALRHGEDPLRAAALGTTAAIAIGFVASLVYLQRAFGASLPLRTVARAAIACAAAILVGRMVPVAGRAALAGCVVAGLVYCAALASTREITPAELRALVRRLPE